MTKDTYYFSHDSNARHDPDICEMRSECGAAGYGWYWIIVEMLREEKDFKLKLCKRNALAMQLQCSPKEAEDFVAACINNYDLFDTDGEYFWSNSLLSRMEKVKEKSEKARQSALMRWQQANGSKKNANAKRTECDSNAINERKVNERKVNETVLVTPPGGAAGDKTVNNIYKAFSQNIHPITPMEYETLSSYVDDGIEEDVVVWAIKEAVVMGKRNVKYITAILNNLHKENITTLEGAVARARDRADGIKTGSINKKGLTKCPSCNAAVKPDNIFVDDSNYIACNECKKKEDKNAG